MERLQKYMASCNVASRRKCEEIILSGVVSVNGETVTELGVKIDSEKDIVKINGELIKKEEKKIYIALNKPNGYISSLNDDKGRDTIMDLIDIKERIYPIGRLDYDSSGLLLMTNDGDIYNKVIHPSREIDKVYYVQLDKLITDRDLSFLERGVDIGGFITSKAKAQIISRKNMKALVAIAIHEGKNRQVRKMFTSLGYNVVSLKRVSIGNIELKDLELGSYRHLEEWEVKYLKNL